VIVLVLASSFLFVKADVECELKEAILEAQVEASFQGHDLGPFEPVEVFTGGYEARCRKCNQSARGWGFWADVRSTRDRCPKATSRLHSTAGGDGLSPPCARVFAPWKPTTRDTGNTNNAPL
jgi:hypothetical protein